MEKVLMVDGMMCNHCKMTVEKALKGVAGVTDAAVDLEKKTATITMENEVPDEALMNAVREKNFTPVKFL